MKTKGWFHDPQNAPEFDEYVENDDHEGDVEREYDAQLCYMGHEDCYDSHTSERLSDEADWEKERDEGLF